MMDCGICQKALDSQRKTICTSCARATLYSPRIEQASALLGREKSHTHIEAVVRSGNDGVLAALSEDADWDAIAAGAQIHSLERARAGKAVAEERIKDVTEKADQLKQQVQDYREIAAKQKDANDRRRKEISRGRRELEKRKAPLLEPVQASIRKAGHRLNKIHGRSIDAREYLCSGISSLRGFRKCKSDAGKTEHRLYGIPLPDLRDINGLNDRIRREFVETSSGIKPVAEIHELLSAAFDNVCTIVMLYCHYLSVRLPAEIILPHNDFPHAAIFPRDASYKTDQVRYPCPGMSQSSTLSNSRVLQKNDAARPRPLQLDRPLPQLQKDSPKAYESFLEGVTWLAYDIAWLCKSQGLDSVNSFDDVCAVPRNIHNAFPARESKRRPPMIRGASFAANTQDRQGAGSSKPRLGINTHASAHHSLACAAGQRIFASWPVSRTVLTDQLKASLRWELSRAEWHYIDDREWDDELEHEKPVMVGGTRKPAHGAASVAMSTMTVAGQDGTAEVKGWMKVRGRGTE